MAVGGPVTIPTVGHVLWLLGKANILFRWACITRSPGVFGLKPACVRCVLPHMHILFIRRSALYFIIFSQSVTLLASSTTTFTNHKLNEQAGLFFLSLVDVWNSSPIAASLKCRVSGVIVYITKILSGFTPRPHLDFSLLKNFIK